MQPSQWRFIPPLELTGDWQMAIDHWLLNQHRQGKSPAILRFYTWQPATISLGYHQRQWPAHWHNLHWQGQTVDLVRRPSGGRAVLHQGDLTYAVIMQGQNRQRRATYCHICKFLQRAWQELGVELSFGQGDRHYREQANCFRVATTADLVLPDGFKIIGSAQLWRGESVLQHGSMRLHPDPELFELTFQEPLSVSPLLTPVSKPSLEQLQAGLLQAAQTSLQADLVEQPLTEDELKVIAQERSQFRVCSE